MNFQVGKLYKDREGNVYRFRGKGQIGSAIIFQDINDDEKYHVRNVDGFYRFDQEERPTDIVFEVKE